MADVTPIIFAGGLGTRLGGVKKALIEVGGRPVVERVLDTVRPLGDEVSELCVVVACDMPFVSADLLAWLVELAEGFDVVMPVNEGQMDPMHAVYRREPCLDAIGRAIARGDKRMISYLGEVRVREVGEAELRARDPDRRSFFNINTPEDLAQARALAG
jgi:molybdopterin-guanine dinucleotide biosynthesis protein A